MDKFSAINCGILGTMAIACATLTGVGIANFHSEPATKEEISLVNEADKLLVTEYTPEYEYYSEPVVYACKPTFSNIDNEVTENPFETQEETTEEEIIEETTTIEESESAVEPTTVVELETASETEWFMNDYTETTAPMFSEYEEYLLMKIAFAEAGTEDALSQAIVMSVVLNRVADPKFPNTIEEVIFQEGQFSVVTNGSYANAIPSSTTQEALDLIKAGSVDTYGATYFSTAASEWHWSHLQYLFNYNKIYLFCEYQY